MRKLKKEHREQQQQHVDAIRTAHEALEDAVNAFNATMGEEWKKVAAALEAYNGRIEDANEFLSKLAKEAQDWHDARREKWQEEKGDEHDAWIDEALSPLDTIELDPPADVEVPEDEASDELEDRPDSPEET